jgi:hypothetical protein
MPQNNITTGIITSIMTQSKAVDPTSYSCIPQAKHPFKEKHQLKNLRRVVPRRISVVSSPKRTIDTPTDVRHKAVRFPYEVATVVTFDKVDQKEAGNIWYSEEENQVLANDCLKCIIAIREAYQNNGNLDDSEHTDLGLERHILPEQAKAYRAAVEAHARRVLRRFAVVISNAAA